jgi:hypothetical protein
LERGIDHNTSSLDADKLDEGKKKQLNTLRERPENLHKTLHARLEGLNKPAIKEAFIKGFMEWTKFSGMKPNPGVWGVGKGFAPSPKGFKGWPPPGWGKGDKGFGKGFKKEGHKDPGHDGKDKLKKTQLRSALQRPEDDFCALASINARRQMAKSWA